MFSEPPVRVAGCDARGFFAALRLPARYLCSGACACALWQGGGMSCGAQPVARAAAQSVVRPLSAELHDSHVAVSWRVRRPRPRSTLRILAAIAGWRHTARGPSGRAVQLSMSRAALAAADGANALRTVRLRRRAYLQRAGRAVRRWLPAVNVKFRYNGVRRRQNRPARPHDAAIAFDLHGDVW